MLDPIILFIQNIFSAIGRGIGYVVAWILFPFMSAGRWYASRGFIIKGVIGLFVGLLLIGYGFFIYQTQVWYGFDPEYPAVYKFDQRKLAAGQPLPGEDAAAPKKCQRSAIVDVAIDLIDNEVNQNHWVSSSPFYKMGLFGMDWDNTPWLDNKASFQRGVNQTVRRTTVELVEALARVRGTSGINRTLQTARESMQYSESAWYINFSPFGFPPTTQSTYRRAIVELQKFNTELETCQATFDGRADNLLEFLDRIANDLGSTSAILRERSENYNAGWFDTRADDRFWFAYGQLYGYYGILSAARADFATTVTDKNIGAIWGGMLTQFRSALRIQPAIISNGREDGWIMPTHLATQGFYVLRARSNLIELRDVLDR
ncbi:MAG: DUF2333 family protein [Rhizobium sp.]|nr:DUF2333 family protein [Rhizobium sp.]